MSHRLLCCLVLLGGVACVEPNESEPSEPVYIEWCEGGGCEESAEREDAPVVPVMEEPAGVEEPVMEAPPEEPVGEPTKDPAEEPIEEPVVTNPELPAVTTQDFGSEEVSQLTVAERYACAVLKEGAVKCWGDDTYGQSSPPDDLSYWGRELVLANDFACVIGVFSSTCWGEGAHKIDAFWDHQIISRYTLYGASISPTTGALCFASGYDEQVSTVLCANDTTTWQVGEQASILPHVSEASGIQSGQRTCFVKLSGDYNAPYSGARFFCANEQEVDELEGPGTYAEGDVQPAIMADPITGALALNAAGELTRFGFRHGWYQPELSWSDSSPMPRFEKLLTPRCAYGQGVVACFDINGQLSGVRDLFGVDLVEAFQSDDTLHLCYAGNPTRCGSLEVNESVKCERIKLK